jgi:hypothetical protein
MTTADFVALYKFFSVNATVLLGGVVSLNVKKASNEKDEDGEMHEQAAQAHEWLSDPKRHAKVEGQDSIIEPDSKQ